MKEDIKQLWECCFTDSQEFIDLYFRLRYKEEINIAILEDGHPISALQMIPYPMTFFDRIWKTAYVSGACTHPQHRAKGAMKELLNRSYQQMYQEGMALTTLIPAEPWLFDYYHTMGYSPVFAYSKQAIDTSTFQASANITINKEKLFSTELYDYFNTKQHERNIYLLHTAEDLNVILSDLALANSGIYVARCAGEITGLAIAYQRETTIEINELMANDDITRKSLYKTIQNDYPQQPLIQLERSTSDGHPLGMARIIRADIVLQDFAHAFPKKELRLQVCDAQIEENNRCFHLSNGICKEEHPVDASQYQPMNIATLTLTLLAPLHPYMNLMLN